MFENVNRQKHEAEVNDFLKKEGIIPKQLAHAKTKVYFDGGYKNTHLYFTEIWYEESK